MSLAFAGAVALAACSERTEQRDLYANLGDCQKDWGLSEKCEPAPAASSSATNGGSLRPGQLWYGPPYNVNVDSRGTPRPSRHALGATHISRGGFGTSSAFHGSSS